MDEIAKVVSALSKPLEGIGYTLVEAKLSRDKDGLTLHLVVDRDDPVSLEDIVKVSDLVNPLLDKADPIASPYTLDISSLGAEKPLAKERLPYYLGRYVNATLSQGVEGHNCYEGTLEKADGVSITLSYRDKARTKSVTIPLTSLAKIRLAIKF
jgi:ribosome maturation factor RimP